jgi:LuxR family maltose regulon positive regulatory protein
VLQRASPAQRAGRPAFDLVVSKLRRPPIPPGTVVRQSLIERLARDDSHPIVSVVAPAGYGKTTLLSQWAERNGQAFAWVSVDEQDNDTKVLLTYVAEALAEVEPISERVFDALASSASSVPGSVVPRLSNAFASMTSPVALILDDVHVLHNSECRAALSVLADHVRGGSRLVLSGRSEPPLRTARLRAEGKIIEIGPGDLSLTREEASALLRAAGVELGEDDVAELHRRTEGWPVGLYLAALHLREGGLPGDAAVAFGGDDRSVSEYVELEFFSRISEQHRAFLARTAVLERLSGPLCEAVLELPRASATLRELERSNGLLVPLDRQGQWYRYHHLFRDMLMADLERREPDMIPVLRRRAATWCLRHDLPEAALEYSMAARDVDTAAALIEQLMLPAYRRGRVTTVQTWFRWLEDQGRIERYPLATVWAALIYAVTGRPVDALRWADAVDRWQNDDEARPANLYAEAWAAVLPPLLCRHGVEQMRADADESVRRFAAAGIVAAAPASLQGIACVLCGDLEAGDASLRDAVSIGKQLGAHEIVAEMLAERWLVAASRSEWDQAEALASQGRTALRQAGTDNLLVHAVQARTALHRGDVAAARLELVSSQRVRPAETYARPYIAVQARIELIRVHLALADIAGARTLMREIDEVLKLRPDLGTLVGEASAVRTQVAKGRGTGSPGASALTAAELRVLPMLSTHQTSAEIAAELFLSLHTVKSQQASLYRKLGASTRSQAVARARQLGLLEG